MKVDMAGVEVEGDHLRNASVLPVVKEYHIQGEFPVLMSSALSVAPL